MYKESLFHSLGTLVTCIYSLLIFHCLFPCRSLLGSWMGVSFDRIAGHISLWRQFAKSCCFNCVTYPVTMATVPAADLFAACITIMLDNKFSEWQINYGILLQ